MSAPFRVNGWDPPNLGFKPNAKRAVEVAICHSIFNVWEQRGAAKVNVAVSGAKGGWWVMRRARVRLDAQPSSECSAAPRGKFKLVLSVTYFGIQCTHKALCWFCIRRHCCSAKEKVNKYCWISYCAHRTQSGNKNYVQGSSKEQQKLNLFLDCQIFAKTQGQADATNNPTIQMKGTKIWKVVVFIL